MLSSFSFGFLRVPVLALQTSTKPKEMKGTSASFAKNATGAFDIGMSLRKLAVFSTTVAKLRTTDQWLQFSLCGKKRY